MSKLFRRFIAILLIPCLVGDPTTAAAFLGYPAYVRSKVIFTNGKRFNEEALEERLLGGYTPSSSKQQAAWLRQEGAHALLLAGLTTAGLYYLGHHPTALDNALVGLRHTWTLLATASFWAVKSPILASVGLLLTVGRGSYEGKMEQDVERRYFLELSKQFRGFSGRQMAKAAGWHNATLLERFRKLGITKQRAKDAKSARNADTSLPVVTRTLKDELREYHRWLIHHFGSERKIAAASGLGHVTVHERHEELDLKKEAAKVRENRPPPESTFPGVKTVLNAWEDSQHQVGETAEALDISQSTLSRWRKKYPELKRKIRVVRVGRLFPGVKVVLKAWEDSQHQVGETAEALDISKPTLKKWREKYSELKRKIKVVRVGRLFPGVRTVLKAWEDSQHQVGETAEALGISISTLKHWRKKPELKQKMEALPEERTFPGVTVVLNALRDNQAYMKPTADALEISEYTLRNWFEDYPQLRREADAIRKKRPANFPGTEVVSKALRKNQAYMAPTADALDIDESTLWKWIKDHPPLQKEVETLRSKRPARSKFPGVRVIVKAFRENQALWKRAARTLGVSVVSLRQWRTDYPKLEEKAEIIRNMLSAKPKFPGLRIVLKALRENKAFWSRTAMALKVSYDTLLQWRKDHPEIERRAEAIRRGLQQEAEAIRIQRENKAKEEAAKRAAALRMQKAVVKPVKVPAKPDIPKIPKIEKMTPPPAKEESPAPKKAVKLKTPTITRRVPKVEAPPKQDIPKIIKIEEATPPASEVALPAPSILVRTYGERRQLLADRLAARRSERNGEIAPPKQRPVPKGSPLGLFDFLMAHPGLWTVTLLAAELGVETSTLRPDITALVTHLGLARGDTSGPEPTYELYPAVRDVAPSIRSILEESQEKFGYRPPVAEIKKLRPEIDAILGYLLALMRMSKENEEREPPAQLPSIAAYIDIEHAWAIHFKQEDESVIHIPLVQDKRKHFNLPPRLFGMEKDPQFSTRSIYEMYHLFINVGKWGVLAREVVTDADQRSAPFRIIEYVQLDPSALVAIQKQLFEAPPDAIHPKMRPLRFKEEEKIGNITGVNLDLPKDKWLSQEEEDKCQRIMADFIDLAQDPFYPVSKAPLFFKSVTPPFPIQLTLGGVVARPLYPFPVRTLIISQKRASPTPSPVLLPPAPASGKLLENGANPSPEPAATSKLPIGVGQKWKPLHQLLSRIGMGWVVWLVFAPFGETRGLVKRLVEAAQQGYRPGTKQYELHWRVAISEFREIHTEEPSQGFEGGVYKKQNNGRWAWGPVDLSDFEQLSRSGETMLKVFEWFFLWPRLEQLTKKLLLRRQQSEASPALIPIPVLRSMGPELLDDVQPTVRPLTFSWLFYLLLLYPPAWLAVGVTHLVLNALVRLGLRPGPMAMANEQIPPAAARLPRSA